MSNKFNFTEKEIQIFKNFLQLNQSMIIYPDGLRHNTPGKTMIAFYDFEQPYDFDKFALYNAQEFINILTNIGEDAQIEVKDDTVEITTKHSNFVYMKTDLEFLEDQFTKDKLEDNPVMKQVDELLKIEMTTETFNILTKMLGILKYNRMYFLNQRKKLTIQLKNDDFDSNTSTNCYSLKVNKDFIEVNELDDNVFSFPSDFFSKILKGDNYIVYLYKVKEMDDTYLVRFQSTDGKLNYIFGADRIEEE